MGIVLGNVKDLSKERLEHITDDAIKAGYVYCHMDSLCMAFKKPNNRMVYISKINGTIYGS